MASSPEIRNDQNARLEALRGTDLLDSPPERAFDRLTHFACRLLKVPVALVSLVGAERQFFKSSRGLSEPWASRRGTLLSHSFCQHVVSSNEPLIINDAREHPLVRDNPAIDDLGVVAYLGIPLLTPEGSVIGSLCAIDSIPREWSEDDVEVLSDLAAIAMSEIAVRLHLRERQAAEAALRASEQRLNATYEHAFVGIAEVDTSGRFLRANEEFSRMSGYSRDELMALNFASLTHPQDRALDAEHFERQLAGATDHYVLEKRYIRKDSQVLWVGVSASMVYDAAGRPLYGVRVVRDISDRKRAERQQRLLIDELNHRMKNTLAVVQAIARQTLKNADVDPQSRKTFEARLMALASAHDVITRENWESADIADVVQAALKPHRAGEQVLFRTSGPSVRIRPKAALALSLALHELATNAAKYGALSAEQGHVEITWEIEPARQGERLRLRWSEHGGPPVEAPEKTGFGSRLVKHGLAAEFEGDVQIEFGPGGLVCAVDAPLAAIVDNGADPRA